MAEQTTTTESAAERRTASGWRWLLRSAVLLGLCVGLTAAAWTYFWWDTRRQCEAFIALTRSSERVKVDDVPDELNAALVYQKAAAAHVAGPPAVSAFQKAGAAGGRPATRMSSDEEAAQRDLAAKNDLAANAAVLKLMRQGRSLDRVCWARPTPSDAYPVPVFVNAANMSRTMAGAIRLEHLAGTEFAAVELWR